MDFATRQYNHNFRMDPIVRFRTDTDFYKFSMGQVIEAKHPMTRVSFEVTNRTKDVRLAEIVDMAEVREQLDHARTLRYTKSELINLQGQTFYGVEGMLKPAFIDHLSRSVLPDYDLSIDAETGQFVFRTEGRWAEVTDWEIHALEIFNELRTRAVMRRMSRSALDILYARAKVKLYAKLQRLASAPGLTVSDFGTRRRHSHLWQEHCILTACEVLGEKFVGTSNVYLAAKHGLEAKGTNAHELPMVYAALAAAQGSDDEAIRASQYDVLKDWQSTYGEHLRIFLPDTFGSTQFLADAPDWIQWWSGARPDSKEPMEAGNELIAFWRRLGQDPSKKLCIFADGMDVRLPGEKLQGSDMISVLDHFRDRLAVTFGWGTTFTNDFVGCPAGDPLALKPLSLVCKVDRVNGHPAVKLSDNHSKARSSSGEELERYRRIFGSAGMAEVPTLV